MAKITDEALKAAIQQFASMGGHARAKALSKQRLKEIGVAGARARWGTGRGDKATKAAGSRRPVAR